MADFPENEIEILDEYVGDDFLAGMIKGLSRDSFAQLKNITPKPKRDQVERISLARKKLLRFLNHPIFKNSRAGLRATMDEILKGNFQAAHTQLNDLANLALLTTVFDFKNALNSSPVSFTVVEKVPNPDSSGKPPFVTEKSPGSIAAYAGPQPTEEPGQRLIGWSSFLAREAEHRFRIDLLQMEINFGLHKFEEAIRLCDGLLALTPSGSPRHKFVAIRSAFAQLALGDQLFRKQRVLSDQDRQAITERYNNAVRLLEEKGVSSDNPLRQQVEAHVTQQKAKLENTLNYLGLWDAFVPNQKFTVLQQLAATQIQAAKASVQSFVAFLQQADAEKEKQNDLQFQRSEELVSLDIHERRREIATLGIDKTDEQIDDFNRQLSVLTRDTVLGGFRAVLSASTGPQAAVGLVGTMFSFVDHADELAHQRRMAQIDRAIAQNEVGIALLERRISELRIEFYEQKLAFLKDKRLNADVLYALAGLNEKRAERQVEAAIFLAYLFERALTFNLGELDIRHIQFDYLDRPLGIFDAVAALEEDFNLVAREVAEVTQQKLGFFEESISLRESYPIQFSRFLQTGEMDFVYSLYQLSKSGPATHQCRLREVGVEVRGLIPPTGFRGTLTHSGRYLVRDRETTIDPSVTRLIPTEEQLVQALEEQRQKGLAAAVVGGVLYYNLEPESKELSQKTQFVSPNPPSEVTLDLFEGIGPTGLWHLEIREHGKLAISDVVLHFAIVSRESDPFLLEPKVEELIRSYENELAEGDLLDKISAFSLRQNFPDTFFSLQTGPADLLLTEEDFPNGLTNLQFKMVIAQALNQTGKGIPGVALEISKPEIGFKQERVTQSDGFSEDLDVPPETLPRDQRFPVAGTWKIRLSDPAQFAQLADLRLIFMYAFEEV